MVVLALWALLGFTGCQKLKVAGLQDRFTPSNDRDWRPEVATIPFAQLNGPQYSLKNIRNCRYVTEEDYVVDYYDRQILIDQIQSVDFIVVPFKNAPKLAHTMMSFGLDDGSYLAVSVEVRKERGEKFNPLLGTGRKFEPEFYNSISNNCTTNLAGHVNEVSPDKINYGWKVLLPGLSAEYAYELGLLDNRIPFVDLTAVALVNDLAEANFEDPQFSQKIRSRRYQLDRYIVRQDMREPTIKGRGDQYLRAQRRSRSTLRR